MRGIIVVAAGTLLFGTSALAQMTTPTVTDPSNPANVSNTPTTDVANQPEQGAPIQRPGPASANDTMSGTNAGTIAPTTGTTISGTMPGSSATGSSMIGAGTANPKNTSDATPPPQRKKRSSKPKPR